jgi:hypothetical protein
VLRDGGTVDGKGGGRTRGRGGGNADDDGVAVGVVATAATDGIVDTTGEGTIGFVFNVSTTDNAFVGEMTDAAALIMVFTDGDDVVGEAFHCFNASNCRCASTLRSDIRTINGP